MTLALSTAVIQKDAFTRDLHRALSRRPIQLSSKYLYDALGSKLFEAICELPEYYPTRTETALYARHSRSIGLRIGAGAVLAELGSGAGEKVRLLLPYMRPRAYAAIDISATALKKATAGLQAEYPLLPIHAVHQDFSAGVRLPAELVNEPRVLWFFPGSSIGNWAPQEATTLLRALATPQAQLLIGIDLVKPSALLTAAYNDALGVTAAFNLNVLARANRETGTDFRLSRFRHLAIYNESETRIEMHLECIHDQVVYLAGERFTIQAGERIHTENSYKYTPERFRHLCESAGWEHQDTWIDPQQWFAVMLFSSNAN